MGRTDYIVTAGVGFDLDRSSAKNTVGAFEAVAATLNTVATKKAAEGFAKNEAQYKKSLDKISKANKKADDDLVSGTKASAKAAQAAIQKGMPKKLTKAQKAKMDPKELKAYNAAFNTSMKGMSSSYAKYAKEAEKMGIKVSKAQGFGKGGSVQDFAKKDAEQRKRLINLSERQHKSEKKKLNEMEKGTKAYQRQAAEVEALKDQLEGQKNLHEDIFQREKTTAKIKAKNSKKERKAENKKRKADKKVIMRQKAINNGLQRMGKLASMSAGKISAGLKNAFVIGTAAATAFFYKMQPLAATVQEFEKTIINANSVFNVTRKELHSVSDEMVRFTLKYGVSAQDMATGLYQLASAGLSAAESQEVLQHTMKLAMATQGDHNALAKLTVQTIMGFGMEMSDSAELVDKFAHSIQKSQLLGGLEVLTNRALEAGIAGRGLRQALAQFAKHADDNSSAMRKLGIEIMDTEGNMRALHDIALDAAAAFGDVTDLEALTIMLEDMNVRGATAFALLVQNADEFDMAVKDIANSAGEATLMAEIQQESLAMQIQRVKNALLAPFLLSDAIGEAEGSLNEFTLRIKELVDQFTEFFIIIGPDGVETYSKHGAALKDFVINVLNEAVLIIEKLKSVFLDQKEGFESFTDLLYLATAPMKMLLDILDYLGPNALKWFIHLKLITSILPLSTLLTLLNARAQMRLGLEIARQNGSKMTLLGLYGLEKIALVAQLIVGKANMKQKVGNLQLETLMNRQKGAGIWLNTKYTMTLWQNTLGWIANNRAMTAGAIMLVAGVAAWTISAIGPLKGLTVVLIALAIAWVAMWAGATLGVASVVAIAAMIVGVMAVKALFPNEAKDVNASGAMAALKFNKERNYDLGGVYLGTAEGGMLSTEHGMAQVQKGETITSKTSNMLGGGGVTLNFGDIHAEDGTDFAEKVATALPDALRRANDQGAI